MRLRPLRFPGRLYPEVPEVHRELLRKELGRGAPPTVSASSQLLLLPHGSLQACAPVFAAGLARAFSPEVEPEVALVGPCHDPGSEIAAARLLIDRGRSWCLPLGEVELVANEEIEALTEEEGFSIEAVQELHDREHSLEVLAASLNVLGSLKSLLPVLITPGFDEKRLQGLANVLERWMIAKPGRWVLVTTDLDHYHKSLSGRQAHEKFMQFLARGDLENLRRELLAGRLNPCGGGPSWLFLELSRRLGREVQVVAYGWAGLSAGAVGYTAAYADPR